MHFYLKSFWKFEKKMPYIFHEKNVLEKYASTYFYVLLAVADAGFVHHHKIGWGIARKRTLRLIANL